MGAQHTPLREQVAAIVDPAVWANLGWRTRQGFDPARDTKHSLAKADAILALPALAAAPALLKALKKLLDHDERDAGCFPSDAHLDAQNVARAALSLAEGEGQMTSEPEKPIWSIADELAMLDPNERLYVHRQNPSDYHNWSRAVGEVIRAGDLLAALKDEVKS